MSDGINDRDIKPAGPPAHGGRRVEAARKYGIPREELLDFSASINPLGPPPGAMNAIRTAAAEVSHYPEEEPAGLVAAAAEHLAVRADEIVLGNGSIELIYWLAVALAPRKVLVIEPTFSEYRRACLAAGARCETLMLSGSDTFALDVDLVEPEGYDLVFLCNPNNPTGYLAPQGDIAALWRRCQATGAGLVVDEAFIEFADVTASVLAHGVSPGVYVLRSFTKSHAIAGLRLGCLAAAPDFIRRMKGRMPPWNINVFAQAAGIAALADRRYAGELAAVNANNKASLFEELSRLHGLEPLPSEANFLLCRLWGIGSAELADRLAREGILVRDCRSFAGMGDSYIRVAVRQEEDNYHLVSALRRVLEHAGNRETVTGSRD